MSYKVIARKYRPQNFNEVIGQEHITRTICKSIKQNKPSHAYLFSGPHGVGKTSLARIIAKALNCQSLLDDCNPCGKCPSCISIYEGNPLDIIEIDGASNRGIENIRTIIENVRMSPISGKYKIYIIDEVHQITNEAFNALLKTLEEPPSHVIFILATTEAEKIMPTIKSRCQQYTFKMLSVHDLSKILKTILDKENIAYDEDAIFLIAKHSRGSVRDAETILEKMIAYTYDKKNINKDDVISVIGSNNFGLIKKFFDIMMSSDKKEYFLFIKDLFSSSVTPITFIDSIIEYMRVVLMIKAGIDDIKILEIPESERDDIKPFVNYFTDTEIENILEYILNVEERVRHALEQKVIFEMRMLTLLDVSNLIRPIDIISSGIDIEKDKNVPYEQKTDISKTYQKDMPQDDKRNAFYKKVLSVIEKESIASYSLLSQGRPVASENATLIVELPDGIYDTVMSDKRIKDLIFKAIEHVTTNKNVSIEFKKSLNNNVLDKLKTTLGAKEVT